MKSIFESAPTFVIPQEIHLVVEQICDQFRSAGYQTVCTFDLKAPGNKNGSCACRIMVLQVYAREGPPFSISFYGELENTTVKLQQCDFDSESVASILSGVARR